tara:strand:+ start:437 stop:655 length:219 start_codon:yes stop_codon:yes gene_type:complete
MSKQSRKAAFAKCNKLNSKSGKRTHTVKKNPQTGMFSCVKMKVENAQKSQTPAKQVEEKTPPKPKTPFSKQN